MMFRLSRRNLCVSVSSNSLRVELVGNLGIVLTRRRVNGLVSTRRVWQCVLNSAPCCDRVTRANCV